MTSKKNSTTLIIIIITLVTAYFSYTNFIYPTYVKKVTQEIDFRLNQSQTIELKKGIDQKMIHSIRLHFTGNSTQNIDFLLSNSDSIPIHSIKLKGGEIDYYYQNDWYSDGAFITLGSTQKQSGQLNLEYEFFD